MAAFITTLPLTLRQTTRLTTPLQPSHRHISPNKLALPSRLHIHHANRTTHMSATTNLPPPPDITGPRSEPTPEQKFKRTRTRIFLTMLLSYATYYITRFSFPFTAPIMMQQHNLTLQQIGLISSCFPAVYGVSKLFSGMVADLRSPRAILSIGLLLAALCNVVFTTGTSVPVFAFIWALNGIVSSVGFPACAKILSQWYSPAERGTYWGLLNVSLNVGGAISPIIVGTAAAKLGWRYGMLVPAMMAACMSLISYVSIVDKPEQLGMPSPNPQLPAAKKVVVEEVKPVQPTTRAAKLAAFRTQITDAVLKQRTVWLLAASYFFVYVVRQALTSWSVFYLMQAKGVASLAEAGVRVSGLEVGGLIGSISSGWLSDVLIKKQPQAGAIGQRVKVILLYLALTAAAASAFFLIPVTKGLLWLQWLMFAFTGMGLYGPQLLVGLCGAEAVDERYAATSNGFVGLTAYVGATLAGFPLSVAVRKLGWGALWGIVVGCCGIVAALLLPLIRKKSFSQSVAEAEAKSA